VLSLASEIRSAPATRSCMVSMDQLPCLSAQMLLVEHQGAWQSLLVAAKLAVADSGPLP